MSASAENSIRISLAIALGFATVLVCVAAAQGQGTLPAAQVVETIARVRASTPGEAGLVSAVALGQGLLIEQRYGEAGKLFDALLDKLPREPAVLYGAALANFNLGSPADAEPLVRSAVEIYLTDAGDRTRAESMAPDQRVHAADALVLLAVILGARGEDTKALENVQRAVVFAPEHFDAQFTLGRAFYSVGDSVAAVKAFRAALKLKPDDTRALFFLATALEGAGDRAAALGTYRDLIARTPQAAEGHLGLGAILIKRGGADIDKGIEELRTAVRIDPNLYEAQVTLGRALLIRQRVNDAVEHLQRAANLAPNNPEPHYQLALAYRRLGLKAKAAEESAIVKRIHETRRGEHAENDGTVKPEER